MSSLYREAKSRAEEYAKRHHLDIEEQLGGGVDGVVLATTQKTAIKALRYTENYERERDAYLRFQEHGIRRLNGFAIPHLINFHDELFVVEMQIVAPPFLVDFAGARLDSPIDFPEEVLEEWEKERIEMFGEERWKEVCILLAQLRRYGIHLSDVKPGNIAFKDEKTD
jgi:hypothetical protein